MRRIGLALATIAWLGMGGSLEGCASRSGGGPRMFVQQEPSPLSAQGQVVRPGEDGTILLRVPTWLADLQLRSGRYEFHQRVDRGERFITVVEVKRYALFKLGVRDSRKLVAEVKCRLVAQGETATETGVHLRSEAGRLRVDWLILEGQDGRYFPESVRR